MRLNIVENGIGQQIAGRRPVGQQLADLRGRDGELGHREGGDAAGRRRPQRARGGQAASEGAKGGELGWNAPANFVKPFSEAMTKLEKGQMTKEPVQSDFGFHVIKLDDVRSAKVPAFDEIKPQISEFLQRKKLEKLMADLRGKAKIEQ